MRRLVVVGGIVAACLAVAAVAYGATNTVTYTSKLSPADPKPKAGKPANIAYEGILDVSNGTNQPDSGPSTKLFFAKQLINNGKKFASCSVGDIDGKPTVPSKCKAALVGSGSGHDALAGVPGTPLSAGVTEQLNVKAYNGSKGKSLMLVIQTLCLVRSFRSPIA